MLRNMLEIMHDGCFHYSPYKKVKTMGNLLSEPSMHGFDASFSNIPRSVF